VRPEPVIEVSVDYLPPPVSVYEGAEFYVPPPVLSVPLVPEVEAQPPPPPEPLTEMEVLYAVTLNLNEPREPDLEALASGIPTKPRVWDPEGHFAEVDNWTEQVASALRVM